MTELGNRFALKDRLPLEWDLCRRKQRPLAVLVADLDHFKRINDVHGHAAGDEVLRLVALTLRKSVRDGDFVARYGGEEFVVVASDCDHAEAIAIARRFRSSLAEKKIALRTTTVQVTSSVGIAPVIDVTRNEPPDVIQRADQALYRAKAAGRNTVWIWDPSSDTPIAAEAEAAVLPARAS